MGLTLLLIYFCCILKAYGFQYKLISNTDISPNSKTNAKTNKIVFNQPRFSAEWTYVKEDFCLEDDDCSWLDNSYCEYSKRKCVCDHRYELIENRCYEKVSLDRFCIFSEQCITSNSYCHLYTCICKEGYFRYIDRCKYFDKVYPKSSKSKETTTILIIVCIVAVVIAGIFIIILIYSIKKRLFDIRMRTENRPTSQLEGFECDTTCYTIETVHEEIDRPPSYEEIIRTSASTCDLITHEMMSDVSCPSYAAVMMQQQQQQQQHQRIRSFSL
ncbi:uncharacterized protein [Centruroides vittatus]|uniref:uncharacterized protein n=1 Tax=Centruroides vittatus TaxID=120091 RepID=UPI00350EA835